jgi:hypothetical protein
MQKKPFLLFLTGNAHNSHAALITELSSTHIVRVMTLPTIGDIREMVHTRRPSGLIMHESVGLQTGLSLGGQIGSQWAFPIIALRKNRAKQAHVPPQYRAALVNESDSNVATAIRQKLQAANAA